MSKSLKKKKGNLRKLIARASYYERFVKRQQKGITKFCLFCGREVPSDAIRCSKCGREL